jgi:hypothetical protein
VNLPSAPPGYTQSDEANVRRALQDADKQNIKRGTDYYVLDGRVILKAPNGSFHALVVDNAGVLSTSPVT